MTIFGKAWHAVKTVFTARTIHLSAWFQGLAASWSKPSFENLIKRAQANPYASRALRIIASNAANVPLAVRIRGEVLYAHPVLDLLKRPNARTSWHHFVDQFVNHVYAGGEVFIQKASPTTGPNRGRPVSMRLWSPGDFVGFIERGRSEPAGFFDRLSPQAQAAALPGDVIGYTFRTKHSEPVSFTVEEMLQARIYNPLDEDHGLPILLGAARALETMEASDDWNKSIASGGGRVPGYWMPKGLPDGVQLTPEQVKAAEDALDKRTRERSTSNLEMVLSGAYDRIGGSVTPKDADWLEGYRSNARAVGAVMGVPSTLIGDEKAGSLTDAGVNSELRALFILTILPLYDWWLAELNAWLMPAYGPGVELIYDEDGIEALQYDIDARYRRYREAAGRPLISVAEGREALGWPTDKLPAELREIATPIGIARPVAAPPVPAQGAPPAPPSKSAVLRLLELATEAA